MRAVCDVCVCVAGCMQPGPTQLPAVSLGRWPSPLGPSGPMWVGGWMCGHPLAACLTPFPYMYRPIKTGCWSASLLTAAP